MMLNAHPDTVLFGENSWGQHDDSFGVQFNGGIDNNGDESLSGITRLDDNHPTTLFDIQSGSRPRGIFNESFRWAGTFKMEGQNVIFTYLMPDVTAFADNRFTDGRVGDTLKLLVDYPIGAQLNPVIGLGLGVADVWLNWGPGTWVVDGMGLEKGDIAVETSGASIYFTLQLTENGYGELIFENDAGLP